MLNEEYLESLEDVGSYDMPEIIKSTLVNGGFLKSFVDGNVVRDNDFTFSHELGDMIDPLDQKQSGRCWAFAALGMMKMYCKNNGNFKNVNLSPAYVAFYHKLETANYFFDVVSKTSHLENDDKIIETLFSKPIQDGGDIHTFTNIVNKYGIVPYEIYPESFSSNNTGMLNKVLNNIVRRDSSKLRKIIREDKLKGDDLESRKKSLKNEMMASVYKTLIVSMGKPPSKDKKFKYVRRIEKEQMSHQTGSFVLPLDKDYTGDELVVTVDGIKIGDVEMPEDILSFPQNLENEKDRLLRSKKILEKEKDNVERGIDNLEQKMQEIEYLADENEDAISDVEQKKMDYEELVEDLNEAERRMEEIEKEIDRNINDVERGERVSTETQRNERVNIRKSKLSRGYHKESLECVCKECGYDDEDCDCDCVKMNTRGKRKYESDGIDSEINVDCTKPFLLPCMKYPKGNECALEEIQEGGNPEFNGPECSLEDPSDIPPPTCQKTVLSVFKNLSSVKVNMKNIPKVKDPYSCKLSKKPKVFSMTPKEFYSSLLPPEAMTFSCLFNDPRKENPYETLYKIEHSSQMTGGKDMEYLNIDMKDMKKYAIKSLLSGKPVWFACDMDQGRHPEINILDDDLMNMKTFLGESKLSKEDRIRFGESRPNHAMILVGVDIDKLEDGYRSKKWKVLNSWGESGNMSGIYSMSDKWFEDHVYEVIVERNSLKPNHLKLLEGGNPKIIPFHDVVSQVKCY